MRAPTSTSDLILVKIQKSNIRKIERASHTYRVIKDLEAKLLKYISESGFISRENNKEKSLLQGRRSGKVGWLHESL